MTHRMPARARRVCALLVLPLLLACGSVRAQDTLTIWWERGSLQAQDDALMQVIGRFESRYKVKVALTLFAAQELVPRLAGALEAGQPPDIGFGSALDLQATASWAHDDQLEDISSVIDPIRQRFDAAALATVFLYDGARQRRAFYAFPLWQQALHIQYWRDMLVDAGLTEGDIPGDWDGYWDFWCTTVQQAYRQRSGTRAYGLGLPMGVDASVSTVAFLTFLDAYNVRLVDDTGRLRVDDPAVRAGLIQAMARYTQPYLRGCTPPSSRSWHDADNAVAFQNRAAVLVPTLSLASAPASLDDKDAPPPGATPGTRLIATTGFPRKPDGGTLVYRASVKTGVVFKDAGNKRDAKKFVSFLLEDAQLTPYVESARGAWFPVMQVAQQRRFWQADPARTVVYRQFMPGTTAFEFTRNHRFTRLNHENVWARAMQRIVRDAIPVDQAVDEMILRIQALARR